MTVIGFWIVVTTVVALLVVGAFAYDRVRRNSRTTSVDGKPGNAHSNDIVVQQEHARNADHSRSW